MSAAIVCKVKNIKPHPNADRLNLGVASGHQIIVEKKVKENDLGVFILNDMQISHEHCLKTNLYRKHPDTGEALGGLFEANRRVRIVKLRGEYSEGFWQPLSAFDWCGKHKLKEHDTFTEINGHEICRKYVTPQTKKAQQNNAKNKKKKSGPRDIIPNFHEHYDTKQLRLNLHKIPIGAQIYITDKIHGTCMSAETKIRMADYSWKKIKQIQQGDFVLGYNHKNEKIEKSKVLKTLVHNPGDNWYEVIGERRGCGFGNSYFKITCTSSHEFLTKEGYKKINLCSDQEDVFLCRKDYKLSYVVRQMLLGKMIGDGSLTIRNKVAKLEFGHKKDHFEYIKLCSKILGKLDSSNLKKEYTSGYGTKIIRGKTKECRAVYNLLSKYKNGLTKEIIKELDILGLAFLFMDDGSLAHSDSQKDRANFALCSLSKKEVSFIQQILKEKYKINSVFYKDKRGYSRLRLNTKDAFVFFHLIREYVPKVLQYKLPLEFRNCFNKEKLTSKIKETFFLVPHKLIKKTNLGTKPYAKRYDITTETGNFFAHDVLVHNSGRTGRHLKETINQNWFQKFIQKFKQPQWEYVSGSRRVVQDFSKNNSGYYKDTQFRKVIHDHISSLGLFKNETLYYEIVGFEDSGRPLMGTYNTKDKDITKQYGKDITFSYGCEPDGIPLKNLYKIYVYRITMANPDGIEIEYSWPQIQKRCKDLGLETVPHITTINFTTPEKLVAECHKLTSGSDIIDNSHPIEGVVLRVEDKDMFDVYKFKGNCYCDLEGIRKNSDTFVDTEEAEE